MPPPGLTNPRHHNKISLSTFVLPPTPTGMTCPPPSLVPLPALSGAVQPADGREGLRLRGATVTEGLCPYCAVGCGQLIYTKGGKIIDIEGNPESPDQRRHALPQGRRRLPARRQPASRDPGALSRALLRSLGDAHLDWAMDLIARRARRRATRTSPLGTSRDDLSTR